MQFVRTLRSVCQLLQYTPLLLDVSLWKGNPRGVLRLAGVLVVVIGPAALVTVMLIWMLPHLLLVPIIGLLAFVVGGARNVPDQGLSNPQRRRQQQWAIWLLVVTVLLWFYQNLWLLQRIASVAASVLIVVLIAALASNSQRTSSTPPVSDTARVPNRPIEQMAGREFEEHVGEMLRHHGYSVTLTQATNDQGVDLVIRKDSKTIAVQCKRTRAPVGIAAVQQVVAGQRMYNAQEAWVVASSAFTPAAKACAEANQVRLIDGGELRKMQSGSWW